MLADIDLAKLEWSLLTSKLAQFAQTDEGHQHCLETAPIFSAEEITTRWDEVIPLRDIIRSGYKAPIGQLESPRKVFKAAEKGQILEGQDLRLVFDILLATKKIISFSGAFASKSPLLKTLNDTLDALPNLSEKIEKTVNPNGQLNDDASPELAYLRELKTNLRKKIEETLDQLLIVPQVADYLQDHYYTVRNDKYVIPIRLDGRGRIKGQIIDTSDSGQTLFLEPSTVSQLNQDLNELEVAEKLEIIRIFRELSADVSRNLNTLGYDYDALTDLDRKHAEACLAVDIDAGKAEISETPCLELIGARHPLVRTAEGKTAVPNTVILRDSTTKKQTVLIVSGPNAGGKTVVLKSVGLLHVMAKAGLLLPVEPNSKIYLFSRIFLELGDSQNLTANLSTFSGHLLGLKPILELTGPNDLVLLDELATGTEPNSGSAIAQAVIEHLADKETTAIITTHFDSLKVLAMNNPRYRNASMEYALATFSPTYKLTLDVPGQSYGLELASKIGIPETIISRARSLRGGAQTSLDDAITSLHAARQNTEDLRQKIAVELLDAEAAKARWTAECKLLEEQRVKTTRSLAAKLEDEVQSLRDEFEGTARELKKVVKEIRTGSAHPETGHEKRRHTEGKLRDLEQKVSALGMTTKNSDLPGEPLEASDVIEGSIVYVLPFKREGTIIKSCLTSDDPIEVQVGLIKVRVSLLDLRKTRTRTLASSQHKKVTPRNPIKETLKSDSIPGFIPQTSTNTIDLRGLDPDQAIDKTLTFLDQALRGNQSFVVLIHGHGSDRLKNAIRSMLRTNCPYDVRFRSGEPNEGGDGVTIVGLS